MEIKVITHNEYDSYTFKDLPIKEEFKLAIKTLLLFEAEKESNKKQILEKVDKGEYRNLDEYSNINQYLNHNPIINTLKQYIWDNGDVEMLHKIAFGVPFEIKGSWSTKHVLIPKSVLPDIKYKEFATSNPKANIAKELGARIIS